MSLKGGQGVAVPAPVSQLGEWEVVVKQRVVGEDWQLSRICLTRCFAVLVDRRVVGEMAIFANHHKQDGRYELPHPLIPFIQTSPTYQLSDPSHLQRLMFVKLMKPEYRSSFTVLICLLLLATTTAAPPPPPSPIFQRYVLSRVLSDIVPRGGASSSESTEEEPAPTLLDAISISSALAPSSTPPPFWKSSSILLLRTTLSICHKTTTLLLSTANKIARASPTLANFLDELSPDSTSADPEAFLNELSVLTKTPPPAAANTAHVYTGDITNTAQLALSTANFILVYVPSAVPDQPNNLLAAISLLESCTGIDTDTPTPVSLVHILRRASLPPLLKRLPSIKLPDGPLLLVLAPGRGGNKFTILAQHHCTPPPTSTELVKWITLLKKRHAVVIKQMKRAIKESRYSAERSELFRETKIKDKEREAREEVEKARKVREAQLEEEICARREVLAEALPAEPSAAAEGFTIKVELDGSTSEKRKFPPTATMSDVFDWVDVAFAVPREKVCLSVTGRDRVITYEDRESTFEQVGVTKMCKLRLGVEEEE